MKKILTGCLLLIMVFFTSCSDDILNYKDTNENDDQSSATFNTVSIWHKDTNDFSGRLKYELCVSKYEYEFSDNITK